MPVVGIAEVQVRPTVTGAQKAIASGMDPAAVAVGKSSGSKMGSALGGALKVGAATVGGAAIAVLGAALTRGFGRLQAIEQARAKLSGLGHTAETVEGIMKNATASVKGTAFGLDEAATVAAGAVASGIKPGKELERTLKLVADGASIAGVPMSEMGAIFNKVASSGKLQGDVLAQLGDKGIPIVALLGESLGVTADEVYDMSKRGTIDFEMFANAMEQGMGGAALKSGETLQGAFKNTLASLGRIGANLMSGVYPLFTKFFQGLMNFMAPLEDTAKVVGAAIGVAMEGAANKIGGLFDVLIKGDFTTRFREAFNVEEDSKLVDFLFNVREGLIKTAGVVQGAAAILFTGNFLGSGIMGMEEDSAFVDFLFRVRDAFLSLGTAGGQLDFSSWDAFKASLGDAGGTVGGAFASIGESLQALGPAFKAFGEQLPNIGGAIAKLGGYSLNLLVAGLSFLAKHVDTIIKWMPAIVGAFIAWRVATALLATAQYKLQMGQVAAAPLLLANSILRFASVRAETALAVATGQTTAATHRSIAAKVLDRVATAAGTAVTWASTVAKNAAALATKALGAAIRFAMGPVGLIIAGITLLVAGLVWFFTQTDLGKDIVKNAFALIQKAAAAVVAWWNDTLLPALKNVGEWFADVWNGAVDVVTVAVQWIQDAVANVVDWWNTNLVPALNIIGEVFATVWDAAAKAVEVAVQWIMDAAGNVASFFDTYVAKPIKLAIEVVAAVFMWWYNTIVKPVFDSIFVIVNGFYLGFRGIFQLVVAIFKNIIAPAFMNFWHGVVEPVFNGIGILINLWWTAVKLIFDTVVSFIKTTFSAAFTWFRDSVITPVFNFIKGAVTLWWTAVKLIFDAVITFVRTVFSAAFTWLRDSVITPVFNFIKNAIDLWWTGTKLIFNAVIDFVRTVFSAAFTWLRDSVISPVFNFIRDAIDRWWTGTKIIFDAAIGFIRDTLGAAFTWLRDTIITPVWNGIKDVISNVWNNGIKPVFDFLSDAITKTLPNAFQTGVDAIKKFWEGLKDVAKAPVVFVIDKVINEGLIGAFNTVAGFIDPGGGTVQKLAPVGKPAGFARGGWTGPGAKYQPAGIVHADEFVVRKESQQDLRKKAPGFLDSLNRFGAKALGYANGGIVNPLKEMMLTQGYNRVHKGIDLGAQVGTPVFATQDGTVTHAGPGARAPGVWGGTEAHIGGGGLETWFAHLSTLMVSVGQQVKAGQQIGLSGNTGITSGPHLHFGVFNGGWPNDVDPTAYLGGAITPSGGAGGFNPIAGLVGMAKDKLAAAFPAGGKMVDFAIGTGEKLIGGVSTWVTDKLGALVDNAVSGVANVADNVGMRAKWLPYITASLARTGHADIGLAGNTESMFRRMMQESGGDPNAVNNWDSNAAAGQSSRGLMQVIPSTFAAYRDQALSSNILDPMANMAAAINYTQSRYGNLRKGWDQPGGYANGGLVNPLLYDNGGVLRPGLSQIVNATGRPEAILNPQQWQDMHRLATSASTGMTYAPTYQWAGNDPARVMAQDKARMRDTLAAFDIR